MALRTPQPAARPAAKFAPATKPVDEKPEDQAGNLDAEAEAARLAAEADAKAKADAEAEAARLAAEADAKAKADADADAEATRLAAEADAKAKADADAARTAAAQANAEACGVSEETVARVIANLPPFVGEVADTIDRNDPAALDRAGLLLVGGRLVTREFYRRGPSYLRELADRLGIDPNDIFAVSGDGGTVVTVAGQKLTVTR